MFFSTQKERDGTFILRQVLSDIIKSKSISLYQHEIYLTQCDIVGFIYQAVHVNKKLSKVKPSRQNINYNLLS